MRNSKNIVVCSKEIIKSWFIIYQLWLIIFLVIRFIVWVPNYFKKILNSLINSI